MADNNIATGRRYPKRIPYGMMNFVAVRRDGCYYVDKTRFIEEVENSNKFFFYIRPRRFGKSLTLSMLQHYYDVNDADKFDMLYKGLYIGDHPTPEHTAGTVTSLGGGAGSELWMQIKADVCKRPFRTLFTVQATSLGAAMLAAEALGWEPAQAAVKQVYRPQSGIDYNEPYAAYRSACTALYRKKG